MAEPADMTAPTLAAMIDLQIRLDGPMSIAHYMALCLTHPRQGYYKTANPLGAKGDFITAPEISQMFGELIGLFLATLWQQLGEPKSVTLLELGPGRGTLIEDALRVASKVEGFANAVHLQLYETHPALRAEQARRLAAYHPFWPDEIDTLSDDPVLIVANEFFDALPIAQFVRSLAGWHERQVGLRDGKRAFGLSPTPLPNAALPEALRNAPPGAVYEQGLAARDVMARLGRAVSQRRGAILAIDYGYAQTQPGDTLQAVARHAFADPLAEPGAVDLSAHVDFGALADAAASANLVVHPLTTQGEFLQRLGIAQRAATLARANPAEIANIEAALRRLVSPEAMGTLFKVLVATSAGLTPPGVAP